MAGPAFLPVAEVRTIIPADILVSRTDRSVAFAPDGRSLASISGDARQVFVRLLDALERVAILTTAAYIRGMFPSPDGRWLAYIENNVHAEEDTHDRGAPVTVATMDGPSRGAGCGPDDTIVFATGAPDTGLQCVASGRGYLSCI